MDVGTLYKLNFSSGKSYIGVTINSLSFRLSQHRQDAKAGSPCAVHRAWRKYGEPKAQVLALVESGMLLETEIRAIAAYGTMGNGYNMTPGGEISCMHIPEIRERAILAMRGKPKPGNAGKKNVMHRPEVLAKLVAIMKLRVYRPETIKRMSDAAKKRDHSHLLGNTNGRANKGKKRPSFSDEWKANMSKAHTPEVCARAWATRRAKQKC